MGLIRAKNGYNEFDLCPMDNDSSLGKPEGVWASPPYVSYGESC